jgi:hypothetical protein
MDKNPFVKEPECPTKCNPWCAAKCHESHRAKAYRDHEPRDCPAWIAYDKRMWP